MALIVEGLPLKETFLNLFKFCYYIKLTKTLEQRYEAFSHFDINLQKFVFPKTHKVRQLSRNSLQ